MFTSAPEFSWSLRAFRFLLLHGTLKTPSVDGPFLNNHRSVSCWRAKNMRSLRNINLLPTLKTEVNMKLTLESKMCHIYFSFWCMHDSSANIHQRKMNVFIICHQNLMTCFMSETIVLFRWHNPRALYFFACHQFPSLARVLTDSMKTSKPAVVLTTFLFQNQMILKSFDWGLDKVSKNLHDAYQKKHRVSYRLHLWWRCFWS